MANKPKRDGTDAENRVRDYAIWRGYRYADRLTLAGVNDRGDIRLGDGIPFVIEVKGGQGAATRPHQHLKELKAEIENAKAEAGAVITKKAGSRNVGEDWVAMMPVEILFDLLNRLYPPPE